ncbi:MAG: TetR/AcrR family transcriptional regulator [Solobacterium sp.]|nr:TetR/AcrR family transcriptional regulator [Solobacterium sp.]
MRFATKQKILHAFNELVQTKDFSSITVNLIAAKAGISHATFYRYFKDKYEVMNYNFALLVEDSLDPDSDQFLQDLFHTLLIEGKEYFSPLLSLFTTEGHNSLHRFICEYSFSFAKNLYETGDPYSSRDPYRTLAKEEKIQLRIFCYGVSHFYEEWLKGNYDIPAAQAARAMYAIVPAVLRGPLRKDR